MNFNFLNPWLLLLIPIIGTYIILTSRKMRIIPKWRKRSIISLKLIVLILVILCLSGLGIKMVTNKATTIFLADMSDSNIKNKPVLEDMIKKVINKKSKSDSIGVVCFGSNSSIEQLPSKNTDFLGLNVKVDGSFTNIEQAFKFASALFPPDDRKRLVLLSDGLENYGEALKQAKLLNQKNIIIDTLSLSGHEINEVQVKEIKLPDIMKLKERFNISVNIESTVNTKGTLRLYADKTIISEKSIDIKKGENNYTFPQNADKGGIITYTAEIDPSDDTIIKNNKLSEFSYVEDKAKVLILQDADNQSSELIKILRSKVDVTVLKPENAPSTLDELQKYNAYILSNIPADKLSESFMKNLDACIKYQGKGLLVTGGESSYAPGGYMNTPLEKLLPVNMAMKTKKNDPNLGLMLVIDKSGSMSEAQYGISKVELAKEAAIRSTEVLKEKDMIGVIGFDSSTTWVVHMQDLSNLKSIQDSIGSIRADGGTQVINSLEEAYDALKGADTKIKHIILLTDGQGEKSGYGNFLNNINKDGITLSTVAVGYAADKETLQALAEQGKGRYYETDEFSDIPTIFTKETLLAAKTYINNRTFAPNLNSYSDVLKGIESIPLLDGYVGTSPKSTAKVVLSSDEDDPLLAVWQYGIGKTIAWTSDAAGMWTSNFMSWNKAPEFWSNILSFILERKSPNDYNLSSTLDAGKVNVKLKLSANEINIGDKAEALFLSPSGKETKALLDATSPGIFEGSFENDDSGTYLSNIEIKKGNESVKKINTVINIPYSPEYNITKSDPNAFMQRLADEGGGHLLNNTGEVFKYSLPPLVRIINVTNFLIILAIILFLMDIALRRLNPDIRKIRNIILETAGAGYRYTVNIFKPVYSKLLKRKRPRKEEELVEQDIEPSVSTSDYLAKLLEKKDKKG